MTDCKTELPIDFPSSRPLDVRFSGLDLSSDAGLMLVRQVDERLGLSAQLAGNIEEWRDPAKIIHSRVQLVQQRVYQLIGGYADANDSSTLRHDPIYKIACGRLPVVGEHLLASQPSITRLENQVSRRDIARIRGQFIDHFIARYESAPSTLTLDIDGWDAPTYGHQQLSFFHGYYGHHMYYPVLINEASSGYPLVLHLRPGNSHPGKGVASLLRWLFWRLRRVWPEVKIVLRADSGFALPELLRLCERAQVGYVIGCRSNAVLKRKIDARLEQARVVACLNETGKARLFDDVYYAAGSWSAPRRVVMKAEWLPKGPNPRFVLTNLDDPPQAIYDHVYVQRGADSEHPIKELKLGLQAKRLSCHQAMANQFRLLLTQAAYVLLLALRHAAADTPLANAQVERLRGSLIKLAARVRVSTRRILIELAAHCPWADTLRTIAHRLCAANPWVLV